MFKRCVIASPEYEFENLTHEQFKTLKDYMDEHYDPYGCDLNSSDCKDYIRYRGGKLTDRWYFCLSFNHISFWKQFHSCHSLEESEELIRNIVDAMDEVANELDNLITEKIES